MASSNNPATQGVNVNEHVREMPKEATPPQRGSQDFVNPPTATLENEKSAVALEETSGLQSQPVGIEKPYSSFTKAEKWFIVVLTSVGGIFRYLGLALIQKNYSKSHKTVLWHPAAIFLPYQLWHNSFTSLLN